MSTRDIVLKFLESHMGKGYTAKEVTFATACTEARVRKHLNDLVEEEILEVRGEMPMYYGFNGFACEFRNECKEELDEERCMRWAHKCEVRKQYLEGNEELLE